MENYLEIDLSQWTQVGEGGNGKTYVNPSRPDVILKINNARLNTLEAVNNEFNESRAVETLGLPVPRIHEIVRVGNAYGTISELIKDKVSLSRIAHDQPELTEEMARILAQKGKELFATPCNTEYFPSRKEQILKAFDKAGFVGRKRRPVIRAFAEAIPECTTCVHGDFQSGNLIKAGDRFFWIDLDRFAYGDPMFDIGHLYLICSLYAPMKQVQNIFHMTLDQFHRFWDAFAKEYTGKENHSDFDLLAGKYACLDIIVRAEFEKPTFAESIFFGFCVKRLFKQYYQ